MPVRQRVYRNNPGKDDHGKTQVAFAVDARELVASGEYLRTPPEGSKFAPEPAPEATPEGDPEVNPGGQKVEDPDSNDALLGTMKRDHLLELADKFKISNTKTMNKPDLVQAIMAAEEQDPGLISVRQEFIASLGRAASQD